MNGGEQLIFGSHAGQRDVRLTTRGRKSGESRTVTIWFVPSSKSSIYVQHVSRRPAHWYRNLLAEQRVEVDFGDGPIAATAIPITDPAGVREVRRLIRRKYLLAWVFQMLGWGAPSVAAEIRGRLAARPETRFLRHPRESGGPGVLAKHGFPLSRE